MKWKAEVERHGAAIESGPLPDGDYDAVVTSVSAKTTGGGKDAFGVRLRVTNGPHRDREVFQQITYSPENDTAVRIFFQDLATLGVSANWIKALDPPNEAIAERMTGQAVAIRVSQRDWNGQARNEVRFLRPLGAGAPRQTPVSTAAVLGEEEIGGYDIGTGNGSVPEDTTPVLDPAADGEQAVVLGGSGSGSGGSGSAADDEPPW